MVANRWDMAETKTFDQHFRNSIQHACSVISAHPAVKKVGKPDYSDTLVRLTMTVEVPLPNAWRAEDKSPHGVRRYEEVCLDFPPRFPIDPPEPSLRSDFSRNLAHMQPWLTHDDRPVPCIQDGDMREFIHQGGIQGIVNQTILWLEHAAEGRLIDPNQGWEPTRLDDIHSIVVADGDALRKRADKRGGFRFLQYNYIRSTHLGGNDAFYGEIIDKQIPLNNKTAKNIFNESPLEPHGKLIFGLGLAFIVWPGKKSSGDPIICDKYFPENVTNLASLKNRAALFGCEKELAKGLSHLKSCVRPYQADIPFNLAIVLCVRRPFNLIGTTTPIELCAYFMDFHAGDAFPNGDATLVQPAGHRDRISPALLARMSGLGNKDNALPWVLIGAGSLGSKLALHMTRAGCAPASVIDSSVISPHNAARHALIPSSGDMQLRFIDAKARLLSEAVQGFLQTTIPLDHDAVDVINTPSLAKKAWPKGTWVIVNTTASLRVRAALSAAGDHLRTRVIESLLYSGGRMGLIATEGPHRNPGLGDLFAYFYAYSRTDEAFREILFETDRNDLERTTVGQGCGSSTMRMSDGRISLFGAATSEYLLSRQREGLPEQHGELLIGLLDKNGLGVSWRQVDVPPFAIIQCDNNAAWSVHISGRAISKITQEVSQWPNVETGGILIGRHEEISKTFHIVDVLSAPLDSTRSASEFILGKKGLRKKIEGYSSDTNWNLYCLGTWHSHLNSSGPSGLDHQTAHTIGIARLTPSVLLIHTTKGFRALLANNPSGEIKQ